MIRIHKTLHFSAIIVCLAQALGAQTSRTNRESGARAFWAKPTTFADFVALSIRSAVGERAQPFTKPANHDFFDNRPDEPSQPARVWIDSASQAITLVLDFTVDRSRRSAADVCSFFLDMIGDAVGARYPKQARNNIMSHYMPPSVFPADTAILSGAYEYLLERMVARVVVFEFANKHQFWCERGVSGRDVLVRHGDLTP
jgi:hypothetical protein